MAKLSLGISQHAPKAQDQPVETQESLYRKACAKLEAVPFIIQKTYKKESLELAASMFEQLGDYLDAKEQAAKCRSLVSAAEEEIRAETYEKALRREQEAETDTEWAHLVNIFSELGDYQEAKVHLAGARKGLAAAQKRLRRRRNRMVAVLVLLLAVIIAGFATGMFRYLYGCAFMQAGINGKARETFEGLNGFLDSEHKAALSEYLAIRQAEDTDVVTFAGQRWTILEREDGKARLILEAPDAENELYAMAYHDTQAEVTWENSTLRAYLNSTFLEELREDAHAYLLPQANAYTENADYGTAYEEAGEDTVTILSAQEAESYSEALTLADADFWLKTPGSTLETAAFYSGSGTVMTYGVPVDSKALTVLPVVWVDYESAIQAG